MSEEFEATEVVPIEETTAAPEIVETETPETPAARTFTQEELDAQISKRLTQERRKFERELANRQVEPSAPAAPVYAEDFDSTEAFAEALAERKAEELLAKREAARQQQALLESYRDREEDAREKYDDFEQVAYNPQLPVTDVMAQAIQASDIGPDVLYHLGANPKEADRIARLSPILQAREIGKLEASLAASPPVKKTTNAPAPIAPVTARTTGSPAFDTTDPRSLKTMSTSEWIEAERARELRRLGG